MSDPRSKPMTDPCVWTLKANPDYEIWESDCGEAWSFEAEGPIGNKMKFCCYCGKPLAEKVIPMRIDDDDD